MAKIITDAAELESIIAAGPEALEAQVAEQAPVEEAPPIPAEPDSVVPQADVDVLEPESPAPEEVPLSPAGAMLSPNDLKALTDYVQLQASNPAADVMDPNQIGPRNPAVNTLPVKLPPGMTQIADPDWPIVSQAITQSFPSMSDTGVILDPMDRTSYAMSVMGNSQLRSDMKAQIIDKVMRDGKVVPEALGRDWYEARGVVLMLPSGGPMR